MQEVTLYRHSLNLIKYAGFSYGNSTLWRLWLNLGFTNVLFLGERGGSFRNQK